MQLFSLIHVCLKRTVKEICKSFFSFSFTSFRARKRNLGSNQ